MRSAPDTPCAPVPRTQYKSIPAIQEPRIRGEEGIKKKQKNAGQGIQARAKNSTYLFSVGFEYPAERKLEKSEAIKRGSG